MACKAELLGWEKPFGLAVVDWLWEKKESLPEMLVIVPTAQSGRRLRESLAERGGVLAPKVVTPGFLTPDGDVPEAVELLAWVEVLEAIDDWEPFGEAFPLPPGVGEAPGWALGLAKSLTSVRGHLREGAYTMYSAADAMSESLEAGRWEALAELEGRVEKLLKQWEQGQNSAFTWPSGVSEVVIAGVADLPERAARVLRSATVTVLLAGDDSEGFDLWGRPEAKAWIEREIAWPQNGGVHLTGEPGQQAEKALELVAEGGRASSDVSLGSADEEVSRELVQTFGRAGWPVFDPGKSSVAGAVKWLAAWRDFIRKPGVPKALDLLGYPQTGALVKGNRAQRARALCRLRDDWMVRTAEDVTRLKDRAEVELAEETMTALEKRRGMFIGKGFHSGMWSILPLVDPEDELGMRAWLEETEPVASVVNRGAGFWLDLLLAGMGKVHEPVPEERVLDLNGWLELLFEEGEHLVICGLNEGKVPSNESSDAWLPEGTRRVLNLPSAETRAARDSYLLTVLLKSREVKGQVDLLLGKVSLGGDMLKPSRLLLAAKGGELARRVRILFQEIEPSDSGLAWTLEDEWKWRPDPEQERERISVSVFREYLACPYRFYLKQVLRMRDTDSEREEWNARDFGNVAHWVLEAWARDEEARELDKVEALEAWLHAELDRQMVLQFGDEMPMAVRIQREAMRKRLGWFARVQAEQYLEGWRVVEVEKNFELEIDGMTVSGQVDRIDHHLDGRVRVLDYKTKAKPTPVATAHLKGSRSNRPVHLEGVEEVDFEGGFWANLQVPLYAAALGEVNEVGYVALGKNEAGVKIDLWPDFDAGLIEQALVCARWVIGQVRAGVFWPPAEKTMYDDFEGLALGRDLEQVTVWKKGGADV